MMTRLVKHDKRHKSGYQIPSDYSNYHENVFVKLGKLEDLEDDLGCPLDVIFKALKYGIRYFDGKTYTTTSKVNYECLLLDMELKAFRVMTEQMPYSNDNWREYDTLYLKDYKKTWWLKDDLCQ